ncbi:uncharacterized protein LY89DRAFT_339504 [Mollisia scopiformis]|uniref:Uncharacterized protein n=1 Tax=Mollisia scopiformis TaxID=149040 RepID=A0A132B790_MOLSC|nr:uncharacterized protein LY89DRAFT_339504 [Mollisia scopiformis]KUJ08275.1 hypothetical protein LY89DRAFT_339504 [Mollisia scopiformis]
MGVLSTESGMKLSEVLEKLETLFKYSGMEENEVRVETELISEIEPYELRSDRGLESVAEAYEFREEGGKVSAAVSNLGKQVIREVNPQFSQSVSISTFWDFARIQRCQGHHPTPSPQLKLACSLEWYDAALANLSMIFESFFTPRQEPPAALTALVRIGPPGEYA